MSVAASDTGDRLDHRLRTLRTFAGSVNNVIAAATACGSTFQREVERERVNFDAFLEETTVPDDGYAEGLQGFFECMEKCGQAFAALAASLTFHTAEPLTTLSRDLSNMKEDIERQLDLHAKQVDQCVQALQEAKERQIQTSTELETWETERRGFDASKNKRLITMFNKKNAARLDRKLRTALACQHAATEEVAGMFTAADLAQKELENSNNNLNISVRKAEVRLCRVVVTSLSAVGGAVEENVEAMRLAAECACTGAQAIKRVHDLEDEGSIVFMQSPQNAHAFNPFMDDNVIRAPDLKAPTRGHLMSRGSSYENNDRDEEASLAEDRDDKGSAKVKKSRTWWNEIDMSAGSPDGRSRAALAAEYSTDKTQRGSAVSSTQGSPPDDVEFDSPAGARRNTEDNCVDGANAGTDQQQAVASASKSVTETQKELDDDDGPFGDGAPRTICFDDDDPFGDGGAMITIASEVYTDPFGDGAMRTIASDADSDIGGSKRVPGSLTHELSGSVNEDILLEGITNTDIA